MAYTCSKNGYGVLFLGLLKQLDLIFSWIVNSSRKILRREQITSRPFDFSCSIELPSVQFLLCQAFGRFGNPVLNC
jgi:hypothetical protein